MHAKAQGSHPRRLLRLFEVRLHWRGRRTTHKFAPIANGPYKVRSVTDGTCAIYRGYVPILHINGCIITNFPSHIHSLPFLSPFFYHILTLYRFAYKGEPERPPKISGTQIIGRRGNIFASDMLIRCRDTENTHRRDKPGEFIQGGDVNKETKKGFLRELSQSSLTRRYKGKRPKEAKVSAPGVEHDVQPFCGSADAPGVSSLPLCGTRAGRPMTGW